MRAPAALSAFGWSGRRLEAGRVLALAAAFLALAALAADGHAQPAPAKTGKQAKAGKTAKPPPEPPFATGPMLVVVAYPAGSGTDLLARALAPRLSERSGQPASVENRPGASGAIGAASVAKAAGDGHTMLVIPAGYTTNALIQRSPIFAEARNLVPVSLLASGPLLLLVHPSLPVKSAKDLIALAAKDKSGKSAKLAFGSPGIGSLAHLSGELFKTMAGVRMTHVPYKDGGAAAAGEKVPVHFMSMRQGLPLVSAQKMRPLGVTGKQRTSIAPEIPTVAESGLAGYNVTNWYGLLAPSSTPPATVKRLSTEVGRAMQAADIKDRMTADGMTVVGSSAEFFRNFLTQENGKYARVIHAAGILSASDK